MARLTAQLATGLRAFNCAVLGLAFNVAAVALPASGAQAAERSANPIEEWVQRFWSDVGNAPTGSIPARSSVPSPVTPVRLETPEQSTASVADNAGFQNWLRRFWADARAAGISAETYNRALTGLTLDPDVLAAANRQAEFVKPIWEYLDSAVSESRITNGRKVQSELSATLDQIEQRYGVDRQVVLAVWGMETSYGAVLENRKIVRSVLRALATLAYADEKRQAFGRIQLLAALKIVQNGDVAPENMMGSWAGAMGHTQFIPVTYLAHAVDFDGDGRRNIWTSVPDALASTANYLRASGWRAGDTWGYEVELPKGFNYAQADEETSRSLGEWQKLGLRRTGARAFPRADDRAALLLPAGARGPAFLVTQNFKAILRYNNATSYALGVGHLADRIAGGGTFARDWPRNDKALGAEERREMQTLLAGRGHNLGNHDGKIGPKTRAAIRTSQVKLGMIADGYPNVEFLSRLRAHQ